MQEQKEQQHGLMVRWELWRAAVVGCATPGLLGCQGRGRHLHRVANGYTGADADPDLKQLMASGRLPF